MLSKLVGLIALQQSTATHGRLWQRLLAGIGLMIFMGLTAAFIASLLIAGVVCLAFNLLLEYGLGMQSAMVVLGILLVFLLIILALTAIYYARRTKEISKQIISTDSPLLCRATNLLSAFMDGFRNQTPRF